jgi:hypothetical protein
MELDARDTLQGRREVGRDRFTLAEGDSLVMYQKYLDFVFSSPLSF